MGSDPAPFFANLFLAHKKLTMKRCNISLEQSMFEKSIIPFSLPGSTLEKHYKDIYPTELELKKESNSNSCATFLDL